MTSSYDNDFRKATEEILGINPYSEKDGNIYSFLKRICGREVSFFFLLFFFSLLIQGA
jgi:hypothetical protein